LIIADGCEAHNATYLRVESPHMHDNK
jgi:hypothetical protein